MQVLSDAVFTGRHFRPRRSGQEDLCPFHLRNLRCFRILKASYARTKLSGLRAAQLRSCGTSDRTHAPLARAFPVAYHGAFSTAPCYAAIFRAPEVPRSGEREDDLAKHIDAGAFIRLGSCHFERSFQVVPAILIGPEYPRKEYGGPKSLLYRNNTTASHHIVRTDIFYVKNITGTIVKELLRRQAWQEGRHVPRCVSKARSGEI